MMINNLFLASSTSFLYNNAIVSLKERLFTSVNSLQKKIAVIALIAFSIIAACYAISRICLKASSVHSHEKEKVVVSSKGDVKVLLKREASDKKEIGIDAKREEPLPKSEALEKEVSKKDDPLESVSLPSEIFEEGHDQPLDSSLIEKEAVSKKEVAAKKDDPEIVPPKPSKMAIDPFKPADVEEKEDTDTAEEKSFCFAALFEQEFNEESPIHRSLPISLDERISMAKQAGPHLTTISFSCSDVTDSQLQEVIKTCPNLQKLSLGYCRKITPASLQELPKGLQSLDLKDWGHLQDCHIKLLPRDLKSLNLDQCKELTEECIPDLPKKLKVLHLHGSNFKVRLRTLPDFLEVLTLNYFKDMSNEWLNDLPQKLHTLTVSNSGHWLTNERLKYLPKNLQSLKLDSCPSSDLNDQLMKQLPKGLKSLHLYHCYHFKGTGFQDLPQGLQTLYCRGKDKIKTDLSKLPGSLLSLDIDADEEFLKNLPKGLQTLNLEDGFSSFDEAVTTDADLSSLPDGLKSLTLSGKKNISDACIKILPKDLQTLELVGCNKLTADALENLPKNLKSLDLSYWEINQFTTDVATSGFLTKLPKNVQTLRLRGCNWLNDDLVKDLPRNLLHLHLDSTKITDAGIKNLPQGLLTLSLEKCTKVTDECLKDLPQGLQTLNLNGCDQLTNSCLKDLPKGLKRMNVSWCDKITQTGLKTLRKDLYVIWNRLFRK